MKFKLSKEKEALVIENMNLVKYVVNRMELFIRPHEYEDMISIGYIGLTKAAIAYEPSKGNKFSTYAVSCIKNEILRYFQSMKNEPKEVINMQEKIGEGDILIEEDTIANNLIYIDNLIEVMSLILNYLTARERFVLLAKMAGMREKDIAKETCLSKNYIQELNARALQKIKSAIEKKQKTDKKFSVKISDDFYIISFFYNEIKEIKEIVLRVMNEMQCCVKVNQMGNRVDIRLPMYHPKTFEFLARFMREYERNKKN